MAEPDLGDRTSWPRYLLEEYGVKLVFHPHADTHVDTQERIERFLSDTDPELVNLCLDTGHIAYCGGNNVEIIERFPERITYVHLKQVDPEVRERVRREKLSLAEAVPLGVMCEPPYGEPKLPALLDALAELDRDIYTVIEQDLYPSSRTSRWPIQARAAGYMRGVRARSGPALAVLTRLLLELKGLSMTLNVGVIGVGHDRAGPHPAASRTSSRGARVTAVTDVDLDRGQERRGGPADAPRHSRPGRS